MATKRVTITIEVDLDAYSQEYGGLVQDQDPSEATEYAKALVIEGAAGRLSTVGGWAKIITATNGRYL